MYSYETGYSIYRHKFFYSVDYIRFGKSGTIVIMSIKATPPPVVKGVSCTLVSKELIKEETTKSQLSVQMGKYTHTQHTKQKQIKQEN